MTYARALQTSTPTSECAYEQAESFRPRSPTTSDKELLSQQLELAHIQLQLEETKLARAHLRHGSPPTFRPLSPPTSTHTSRLGKALASDTTLECFSGGDPEEYLAKFVAAAIKHRIHPDQWAAELGLKLTGNAGLWFDSWAGVHGRTDNYDRLSSALVSEYANPWSAAQIYVQYGQTLTCSYAALPRTLALQQLKMDRAGIPRELYSEERRFYHMQNYLSGSPQVLANIQAQMEAQGELGEAQPRLLEQRERAKAGGRLSIMPPSSDSTAFFQWRCTFVAHCLKLLSDDQGPV